MGDFGPPIIKEQEMERPDGTFYKKLKELDPKLDCFLNYDLKKRKNLKDPLYCITYDRPVRGPIIIKVIHDGNWGFRHPNPRDLDWLHERDMHKDTIRNRIQNTAKIMEEARAIKEEKQTDDFRAMTKEGKYQLMYELNKIGGAGKGAKHVRPVNVKSKGFTIEDLRKLKNNNTKTKKD